MKLPIPVFDAHCDTISRILHTGESLASAGGMVSLDRTEAAFTEYNQIFALFATGGDVEARYHQLLRCFREQMEANQGRIRHCRTPAEAEEAHRQGLAAAFLSIEGAELIGCDIARLQEAKGAGVVCINLTWNHANALSGSHMDRPEQGLTQQGKDFVREMRRLGILPDVSHLSEPGFWDVAALGGPILASHSNAKFICGHTRNLTDDQITAIIESRGVIGLNFYRDFLGGDLTLDTVRRHLDHILSLGGAKCVALGGDWDGCDTIDALPAVDALNGLYEYLNQRGYSQELLEDFFAGNLMRLLRTPAESTAL